MIFSKYLFDIMKRANQKFYQSFYEHSGIDVVDEEWDSLFILDGCRYDTFESTCEMCGDLDVRISHGTESSEFIKNNFVGRQIYDTIYISANPYTRIIPDDTFFKSDQYA